VASARACRRTGIIDDCESITYDIVAQEGVRAMRPRATAMPEHRTTDAAARHTLGGDRHNAAPVMPAGTAGAVSR
jgi:hypothetical protein